MKGHPIPYTAHQLAFVSRRRRMPRAALYAAFIKRFPRRRDVTANALKQLCQRKGWKTGRTGCFPKGNVPYNFGKKRPSHPNSKRTQFKPGSLPPNTKYLGHERVSKDGYVEISVDQVNPHTGYSRRYVLKHRWLWEQKHGPVPKGHALKCKTVRTNCDPSNWELVPRSLLPRLNGVYGRGYDEAPAELKPAIMAAAKLAQKLHEKRKARA